MNKLIQLYEKKDKKGKVLLTLLLCFAFLFLFLLISYTVGSIFSIIEKEGDIYSNFYWGLVSPVGRPITFLFMGAIIFIFFSSKRKLQNSVAISDDRGIHYMQDNTYGSSRWLSEKEVLRSFEVEDIRNTNSTIYGQLSENGEKVVGFKPKENGGEGNRNVLMIATMGSGKSFGYVRTELIQAALRGNSFVVTDPSAELYTDLSYFLRNRGLDVKVLNLDNPNYSDFWNCLDETINPTTERIDAMRLNEFASIYIKNSAPMVLGGAKEDPFFVPSAENLLKAVIGYTAWKKENPIIQNYLELYHIVSNLPKNASNDFTTRITGLKDQMGRVIREPEHIGFPIIRKEIQRVAEENGYDSNEISEIIQRIENESKEQEYTIKNVYENLKYHLGDIEKAMEIIPISNPAKAPWTTYNASSKQEVKAQIQQGLQLRLNLFDDDILRETLSHQGIKISDINRKQSAYFVIMSDKSIATKPIASLFFSFLFKDAQENWDLESQLSKEKGIKNPCLDLVTMLDEFFSIGVIGGSPEAFGITMSNSRKRHIYISIILQVYSQLEALYGKFIANIIQGGCDTLLYLGGNDPDTCRFISEFVSGEATILSESHKEFYSMFSPNISNDTTIRQDKRFVLTSKEASMWKDKVLVSRRGELPLKLNPFPWTMHPVYVNGEVKPESVFSSIKSLDERLSENSSHQINDIRSVINSIKKDSSTIRLNDMLVNAKTGEILEENVWQTTGRKGKRGNNSPLNN